MTDEAYQAKEWLNRTIDLYNEAEKARHIVELIETKLNSAVGNYEHGSKLDPVMAQARRETLLIEYSEKKEEHERAYTRYVRQEFITLNVLDRMKNRRYVAILIDRHINHKSIETMAKEGTYDMQKTQLYNQYKMALEELAPLLATAEPAAIREVEASFNQYKSPAAL